MKEKSILDGVKLICSHCGKTSDEHYNCFPCYGTQVSERVVVGQHGGPQYHLKVVSYCPNCRSPIYGPEEVSCGEELTVKRTCSCLPGVTYPSKNLSDVMETK